MASYRYLFGPVPSRRLGRSLGVDLIPHKTCSLDCVFCQLGRTTEKTLKIKEYVPVSEVKNEIVQWLKDGGTADYITLSGSGEPTLNAGLADVLNFLKSAPMPSALLTNGTMLSLPEVRNAACLANLVKLSLSAWDDASFDWVNRPHRGIHFEKLIEGQRAFRRLYRGELWVEVFLLSGINATDDSVKKIAEMVKEIRPDRVQLNTVVRPPAEDYAVAVNREQMVRFCSFFDPVGEVIGEFESSMEAGMMASEDKILEMIKRRPCTLDQISKVFGMHVNEVSKYMGHLVRNDVVKIDRMRHGVYYRFIGSADDPDNRKNETMR